MKKRWIRPFAVAIWLGAASSLSIAPSPSRAGDESIVSGVTRAHVLRTSGRHAAAESLVTLLIAQLEASPEPDSLLLAEALFVRAVTRVDQAKHDDIARQSAARAFGIRSRQLGANDFLTAEAERVLAEASGNDVDRALFHARHSLDVYLLQKVPNDTLIATAWVDIGQLENSRGQYRSALEALQHGLELRSRAFGAESVRLVSILSAMSYSLLELGDLESAREFSEHALRIIDRTTPGTDRRRMRPLSVLLSLDYRLGDWPQALERARQVAAIAVACKDTLNLTLVSINLGAILGEAGDDAGASDVLRSILPYADKYTGNLGWIPNTVRQSLAQSCARSGDTVTAMTLYREAGVKARQRSDPASRQTLALCLLGQAAVLEQEKRHREALSLNRRGIALNDSAAPPERISLVTSRTQHIAMLEAVRDTAAIDSLRNELADVRDRHHFAGTAMAPIIDYWLARADHDLGRDESAWKLALEADQGIREQLQLSVERLSDSRALDLARRKPYVLGQVLQLAGMERPERWETAWDRLVRTRGLVGAELARRRMPPALVSDTLVVARHAAWTTAQRKLARWLVQASSAPVDSAGRATLASLRTEVDRSEAAYARALGDRSVDSERVEVGIVDVRRTLAPGSALVAFAEIEGYDNVLRLAAFVTRAGDARIDRIEFGRSDSLRVAVDRWRALLASSPGTEAHAQRRAERECRRRGEHVRRLVWDPVARLVEDVANIALVPDGPIIDLPFHALPEGSDHYLVEHGPLVRMLNAERDLVRARPSSRLTTILAVGDPDYGAAGAAIEPPTLAMLPGSAVESPLSRSIDPCSSDLPASFPALPATRAEVQGIASTWNRAAEHRSTVLLGAEASEKAFKQFAPRSAVIHLATHGVVLGDRCQNATDGGGLRGVGGVDPVYGAPGSPSAKPPGPKETVRRLEPSPWMGRRVWLALAGADHAHDVSLNEDDGLLTAEEVVTLNLADTEWVVLSACYSALAENWTREGTLGMRRAFSLAGARSVIASQWAVEDAATAAWMQTLYRVRAAGEPRASAALQTTCRNMLAERRRAGQTSHPFYWAAFVASGE